MLGVLKPCLRVASSSILKQHTLRHFSKMPCQELNKMSPVEVRAFLDSFDTVMTDCDGVLWAGNNEIEGSANMIRTFRELGKKVFFCTNNSTKSRKEYVKKCAALNFGGDIEEILGTSYLAANYLKDIGYKGKVYVVGTTGVTQELDEVGIPHVGLGTSGEVDSGFVLRNFDLDPEVKAVIVSFTRSFDYQAVVEACQYLGAGKDVLFLATEPDAQIPGKLPDGSFINLPENWNLDEFAKMVSEMDPEIKCVVCGMDQLISYLKLMKAASVLNRPNSIFIGTNTDEQFPYKGNAILPGTGAIVNAVATAADREPIIMGKPHPMMFETVKKKYPQVDPKRTLMIGDRANTDILLGKNCGLKTLMVGTGCHSLKNIREWEASDDTEKQKLAADFYVDRLGDLKSLM